MVSSENGEQHRGTVGRTVGAGQHSEQPCGPDLGNGRPGLITFAAIMMFVVGGFHILLAMSEIARIAWVPSSVVVVPVIQALIVRGIVDLIIGFIALYAGGSILRGGTFGWIVGYTFAALGIIRWLF